MKNIFRPGDKVYTLITSTNLQGNLILAKIITKTVRNHLKRYNVIYFNKSTFIKYKNKYLNFGRSVHLSRVAPKTKIGKRFLETKRKRLIAAQIGLLTKEKNRLRNLLK